ncbi:TIGR03016 family PEP-CTERM system-associated outer membrane protein [Sulfurirhabdus autotrophica]|uniref:TIGR03016 family PEP-CTERM system-associated outer membrane protein n=1 Tax=Sulfurirhabdus autotrophica TaxID=1706046 RepID=UPI0014050F6C|nr:TIGR03016 family PEP-CTERM system-associated outer membrane protein [Sulfurirhabdus autotrophica]
MAIKNATLNASVARPFISYISTLLIALLSSTAANAADWKVTPTFSVLETYSDNVNLSSQNQKSGFTTQIAPGVTVSGKSVGRVKLDVNYSLQDVISLGEVQRNRLYHQLAGTANAELVDQTLYMDARANIGQQNISALGPQGTDTTTGDTSNITTVSTYSLSPYLLHKFGSVATGQARFTHDQAFYSSGGVADSTSNAVALSLNSGQSFNDVFWGLNYKNSKITSDNSQSDRESKSTSGTLGYNLTPKFRLFTSAGNETNTYATAPGASTGGSFWSAGFGWTPSDRTSLQASYGRRFFGKTYTLDLSHHTRMTTWSAKYSQDVTDTRTVALQPKAYDAYIDPTTHQLVFYRDATGNLSPKILDTPFLTNDVYINKLFTASVSINSGKSNVGLTAYNSVREFQVSGNSDRQYGGNAAWTLRLNPLLSSNVSAGWNRVLAPASSLQNDLWIVRLSLIRQFVPGTSGSVELRHQERTSNQANSDYTENGITARLNMTFN